MRGLTAEERRLLTEPTDDRHLTDNEVLVVTQLVNRGLLQHMGVRCENNCVIICFKTTRMGHLIARLS